MAHGFFTFNFSFLIAPRACSSLKNAPLTTLTPEYKNIK